MAEKTIRVDIDNIYKYWRTYLMSRTSVRYFGTIFDYTKVAEFPYANLRLISRATDGGDLQGDESSISLVFETECYIKDNKVLTLYEVDTHSADYFLTLGFRRIGDSQIVRVTDTVTKIMSRFSLAHYCGSFLREPGTFN